MTDPIPIAVCVNVPPGELWMGPATGDPFAAFGPGTTRGGRAEAGWFEVGTLAEDGLKFGDPHRKTGLSSTK